MSEKRRGLGRGLGALIPTAPDLERPVDVFFPPKQLVEGEEPNSTAIADSAAVVAKLRAPREPKKTTGGSQRSSMASALSSSAGGSGNASATASQRDRGTVRIDSVSREKYLAATGTEPESTLVPVPGATFAHLPVESIRPNARQPRTVFDEGDLAELVGSIREIGVLQPIVVRPTDEPDRYELIMGERRWRASQEAGLGAIPAIIRETEDGDLLRDALL